MENMENYTVGEITSIIDEIESRIGKIEDKPLGEKPVSLKTKLEKIKVEKEKQKIDHDEKDHGLKLIIAYFLLSLLSIQATTIFILVFFEGFDFKKFHLDNYIFYILISGTLVESYFLVKIVVDHLFPKKKEKDKS